MTDHIVRATVPGIRAFAAVTTALAEEARRRHDCYPVAAAALGRTMTAALLLASNLKTDEYLTIRLEGDGPLGGVVADAHSSGTVRGYVRHPQIELPLHNGKLAVGQGVGKGFIHVTRFTGMKEPFTGSVPLVSGEVGEDVANYLLVSEQTPSTVSLGVLVNPDGSVAAAGGLLVQAMPGAEEELLAAVEGNLSSLPPISQLVNEGSDAAAILAKVFAGLPSTRFEPGRLAFRCQCSMERVENMLISLGRDELQEMAGEGRAEICCHFCGETYILGRERLEELAQQAGNP
ncbi:MAG TPA: Hsp33 family molecular chaperone HslO [Selenomonadales bacterium]|nr:Hsp33 family molecular chaperone HslO [Selenomonadales bacterium]